MLWATPMCPTIHCEVQTASHCQLIVTTRRNHLILAFQPFISGEKSRLQRFSLTPPSTDRNRSQKRVGDNGCDLRLLLTKAETYVTNQPPLAIRLMQESLHRLHLAIDHAISATKAILQTGCASGRSCKLSSEDKSTELLQYHHMRGCGGLLRP